MAGKEGIETLYTNRELSWIQFNERVLEESEDQRVPLYERLKFVAIFQSNLDEFFMVRVGSLYDQTLLLSLIHILPLSRRPVLRAAAGRVLRRRWNSL